MNIDVPNNFQSPSGCKLKDSSLRFGDDCLSNETLRRLEFHEHLEENQVVKSASADVELPEDVRWDYHSKAHLQGPQNLQHRGMCVKAEWQEDGSMHFSFEGTLTEFKRSSVKNIEIFGMSTLEIAYWFPLLTGLVRGVEIPGLSLDTEFRPFLYAVPVKGLTATGLKKDFFYRDFGVISGDNDDLFQPRLNASNIGKNEPVWCSEVPKAWGIVFASDLLEAERIALSRAQFTADLISFGLRSGISHFETRYEAVPLEWDIDIGRAKITLEPWIMFLDQKNNKGWIRTVPLVALDSTIDLEQGFERVSFFASRFLDASEVGNFTDQANKRILSKRERKLSAGIQRSLRWLSIAWNEVNVNDQFIATWISFESILNSAELPKVFGGDRKPVGSVLKQAMSKIRFSKQVNPNLNISKEMIQNRLLQNQWPLRTRLSLFADAFGIRLKSSDTKLIGSLSKVRNSIFHDGRTDLEVSSEQLRQLQYLVERLLVAASVYGYEDVEERRRHLLQFGEIGPEGGAAPLTLNGRNVPYTFRVVQTESGVQIEEVVIEGKIYGRHNSDISFPKSECNSNT